MEAQKPNTPQKPVAAKSAKTQGEHKVRGIKNAFLVIVCCAVVAVCLFLFLFGNPSHFDTTLTGSSVAFLDNPEGHWKPTDLIGTVFMGGVIVPVLQTLFLTVIVLSVERAIALSSAKGTGSISKFVENVKASLQKGDIKKAQELCKKQKGSVAAVVAAALTKYDEMDKNETLTKEQKLTSLQQAVEEATALEMPSLQQNLPIVATMTTLGTLVGLLGTVLGMIKSFQALGNAGAPDSAELSKGISEALVNTASGILTAVCALIGYNFFTNKIDNLTYAVDELGFAIVNAYAANHAN